MISLEASRLIAETHFEILSTNAIKEAKRSLLNWLGVAIAGASHESADILLSVSKQMESSPQSVVIGRKEKTDMLFAALINGMNSHIHDFDDTLLDTVFHPSAPIYPAVLAYAGHHGKTGKDVLESFVVGVEIAQRLALAVYPSHYWRGWHITGSVGGIGAAAAVSKLLGLGVNEINYAIGIAGTEPVGLREMFGTMTKSFHPGKAAMNGLLASLLAAEGYTSSKEPLEAKRGFIKVLSEENKLDELTTNWGKGWKVEQNSFKPFASGVVTHPSIDGVIKMQKQHRLVADQIDEIFLTVHPLVKELTGKRIITNGLEGKFSVYHCVAAGFLQGKVGLAEFTDDYVNSTEVRELSDKVHIIIDEMMEEDQASVQIKLNNGIIHKHSVVNAIGSAGNPMTDEQLESKFIEVTGTILSKDAKLQLIKLIWDFENVYDLRHFLELCRPV